jgi:hypothetical protein
MQPREWTGDAVWGVMFAGSLVPACFGKVHFSRQEQRAALKWLRSSLAANRPGDGFWIDAAAAGLVFWCGDCEACLLRRNEKPERPLDSPPTTSWRPKGPFH